MERLWSQLAPRNQVGELASVAVDAVRSRRELVLEHQTPVKIAAFSPDGTRVVTASWDHTAPVWDAATGQRITRRLAHQGAVVSPAFSPEGTCVVTASVDQTARVHVENCDAHDVPRAF